jgi:hypothetical protein
MLRGNLGVKQYSVRLIFIFNLIDAVLTSIQVDIHGVQIEANPLMRSLLEAGGILGFLIVKISVVGLVIHLLIDEVTAEVWAAIAAVYGLLMIYWSIILW